MFFEISIYSRYDLRLTIISNINILAGASLSDAAWIILAEGVALEKEITDTATAKNINILSFGKGMYEAAVILSKLL